MVIINGHYNKLMLHFTLQVPGAVLEALMIIELYCTSTPECIEHTMQGSLEHTREPGQLRAYQVREPGQHSVPGNQGSSEHTREPGQLRAYQGTRAACNILVLASLYPVIVGRIHEFSYPKHEYD